MNPNFYCYDRRAVASLTRSSKLRSSLWFSTLSAGALALWGLGVSPVRASTDQAAIAIERLAAAEGMDNQLPSFPEPGSTDDSANDSTSDSISEFGPESTQPSTDFNQTPVAVDALNSASVSQAASPSQEAQPSASQASEAVPPVDTVETLATQPSQPATIDQTDVAQTPVESVKSAPAIVAQADTTTPSPADNVRRQGSDVLGSPSIQLQPTLQLQGVYVLQGDESSARARAAGIYPISPTSLFGAVVDLTTGDGFSDSGQSGLSLNELYYATAPVKQLPGLRFVVGLMDLTSYFDRNSFAKDGASHFFNLAFQTNPALSAAGLSSRPGFLVNWSVNDNVDIKATTFSSRRSLGSFALDGFAGEIGVRFGTAILRGTYITSKDAGQDTGFREIFDIGRGGGDFGLRSGDREHAYGINGEFFIPRLKLGFFGRYGRYENSSIDRGADTYSVGLSFLDLFMPDDRLGLAYGRQLSNDDLRRDRDDKVPDVLELYYDFRISPNLRAAVTLQERNQFSETILGFRIKTDFNFAFGR